MPKPNVRIVKNDFAKVRKNVSEAVVAEVRAVTEDLFWESVAIAPQDKGDLRASAQTKYTKQGMRGWVQFTAPYAAVQHERTDFVHDDGQAKYLEQPLEQNRADYQKRLFEAVKKEVK